MNILDENIIASQRQRWRSWRIRVRQIGVDIARKGLQDEEILPFLHHLRRPTFFTRDRGCYRREVCHRQYGIACLEVVPEEVAIFVRRVLRHPRLNTQTKRLGTVVRASHRGLGIWQLHAQEEEVILWGLQGTSGTLSSGSRAFWGKNGMKKLLIVAYESRFARCGGITAVLNHLPGYLRSVAGQATCVITPFHHKITETRNLPVRPVGQVPVPFFGDSVQVKIYRYDDRWYWYFLDAQHYVLPEARQLVGKDKEKDRQFFAGLRHPYDVGTNAAEQWAILRRDSLFFGAAVARAIQEIGPGIAWTLIMQDWQAATAALALAGPNQNHNTRLFLTLHNSYDSGPIKPEDLQGVGLDPNHVPAPTVYSKKENRVVLVSTVLGRAMPLLNRPFFTVSEQFARDFTEDILQSEVMADHLQDMLKSPNLIGVNNGPFTSLAVPEKPGLAEARRCNYTPLRAWKHQKRQEAVEALNEFRKTKDLIKALLCLATDDAKKEQIIQDIPQLQEDEAKKNALARSLRGTVTNEEEQKELMEILDRLVTFEDLRGDIVAALTADDPKPVWGRIADFVEKANASPDMPWFVLAGRDDTRQKGYDVAAEAIRTFFGKGGNDTKAQFLFFPIPGDEGREGLLFLRQLAEDYKANVLILPFIFQEGYTAALQGAAFGVMPSFYEPFGMANEFYLNGAVGLGRATGGLLQQIVPLRSVPSFTPDVDRQSSHWYPPAVPATGLLYREPDDKDDDHDVADDWEAFNKVGYLSPPGEDRIAERKKYRLFRDMASALEQALVDAIDVYTKPPAPNGMQLYYSMLVEGIGHIQRGFSWEWSAAEYNSYLTL